MGDPIDEAKRALRARLRARRRQSSPSARAQAAEGIAAQMERVVTERGATSLSCYLSTPTEPGTGPFLSAMAGRGIHVLLPITRADGLLDWVAADPDADIVDGPLRVPEQTGPRLGPGAIDDVDLMIVPAAAVDRSGMRLGWGRGCFDKTLGAMPRVPPVYAVVYDDEVFDEVPRDLHDRPVTGVVTPTRTLQLAPAGR